MKMKKIFFPALLGIVLSVTLMGQQNNRPQISTEDRSKMTVDKIAATVTLTAKQKIDMTAIFTKFYDDVRAQQAFRDPAKLEPLEKTRDSKVEKLLNNKKSYRQYQDAVAAMKSQYQQRQGHPQQH